MGRTLLSDAFDFGFPNSLRPGMKMTIPQNPKSTASDKSVRPTHNPLWDNEETSRESFPIRGHLITVDKNRFFFQHYGLTEHDLERYLAAALSAGGEYADLYFEYLSSTSLMVDESMVKSASQGISAGCGVRVVVRRAHRLRLHRRSFVRAHSARGAHRGPDRQRAVQDAGSGFPGEGRRAVFIR